MLLKIKQTLILCLLIIVSYAQSINYFNNYLQHTNQVVFVKANSDSTVSGNLKLYERKNAKHTFKLVDSFDVVVGRNGLAKDNQSHLDFPPNFPVKHEGDGKSPAGIFKVGPVFSYHTLHHVHIKAVKVNTTDLCVDDANSIYYNQHINSDSIKNIDYKSFEYMKRKDSLYEYGVWVQYNSDPVIEGNGSCIFTHLAK